MDKIQIIALTGSLVLIVFIISLIRRRRLKEEYSLLWLLFSFVFLGLSIWKDGLDWFAMKVGISYAPAALFLILIMSVFIMMIEFSLIISKQSEWIKQSAQDIGILKLEIDDLEKSRGEIIKALEKKEEIQESDEAVKKTGKLVKMKLNRDSKVASPSLN